MAKKNLHPKWYKTKIFCDSELILEIGTTKEELHIDIWAGNHPFYTGSQKVIDTEGRISKFKKRYNLNSEVNLINEKE